MNTVRTPCQVPLVIPSKATLSLSLESSQLVVPMTPQDEMYCLYIICRLYNVWLQCLATICPSYVRYSTAASKIPPVKVPHYVSPGNS